MVGLKPGAIEKLQDLLDAQVANQLPSAFLTVVSPTGVLFDGASGHYDPLNPNRAASTDDVMWFASTSKLVTSICYLILVDRGLLTLDTPMTDKYPPLKAAASRILEGFEDGQPVFKDNSESITLLQLLNQSGGFAREMGPKVQEWKKWTPRGKGFVNSCKIENLVNTPICFEPGRDYDYGNGAEWLALMFPTVAGEEYEEFLQREICEPLGLTGTTWYPFGAGWDDRLMPLRYGEEAIPGSWQLGASVHAEPKDTKITYQVLNGQLDLLTLPRIRSEIEYPAGGGGIYSKPSDYALILQYLLRHYLSLTDPSMSMDRKILSDHAVESLFRGMLQAPKALESMLDFMKRVRDSDSLEVGEVDWTTGMALVDPKDKHRRNGWGRHAGSVGWGGAAGTEYWIDPVEQIAVVWTTQMLPPGFPLVNLAKRQVEKTVYEQIT